MGSGRGRDDGKKGGAPLLGEADSLGYRRPLPAFSTNARTPSANDLARQGFSGGSALTGGMDRNLSGGEGRRLRISASPQIDPRFLAALYGADHGPRGGAAISDFLAMLGRRSAVVGAGIAITFLVYLTMRLVAERSLNVRIGWPLCSACPPRCSSRRSTIRLLHLRAARRDQDGSGAQCNGLEPSKWRRARSSKSP